MSFFDFGPAVGNDGKRGNGNGTAWRRSATDSVVGEQEKKTQVYDVRSLRRKNQCTPYATLLLRLVFIFRPRRHRGRRPLPSQKGRRLSRVLPQATQSQHRGGVLMRYSHHIAAACF